ncbi:hypothetical protein PIB30_030914 [Stylosanthes scabra]|uniref:F-box domain-containing protein n=1 Tax=Stylosanthes scabra TaxID=79078 RepID=A0ABU6ZCE1_9FABA|nr:hypothetical protein [Stylosanthes scabra]
METLHHNIPTEIMLMFFIRLDSQTFARCRCLSTYWCSTLKEPYVVSKHISLNYGPNVLLHLGHPLLDFIIGSISLYDLYTERKVIIPPPTPWSGFYLIGSIEGYILARYFFQHRSNCRLILWNPLTKAHRFIEEPALIRSLQYTTSNHGCIYSFFKFLNTHRFGILLLLKSYSNDGSYKVLLFNSLTESWTCHGNTPSSLNVVISVPIHVQDSIFYINQVGAYATKSIFSLNLSTLEWSQSIIPDRLNNPYNSRLIPRNGRLVYLSMETHQPRRIMNLTDLTIHGGRITEWGPTSNLHLHNFYYTPSIISENMLIAIDRSILNQSSSTPNESRITTISFTMVDTNAGLQIPKGSLSRHSTIGVVDSFLFQPKIDDNIGFMFRSSEVFHGLPLPPTVPKAVY